MFGDLVENTSLKGDFSWLRWSHLVTVNRDIVARDEGMSKYGACTRNKYHYAMTFRESASVIRESGPGDQPALNVRHGRLQHPTDFGA